MDDRVVFKADGTYALLDTGFPHSISENGAIGPFKAFDAMPGGLVGSAKDFLSRFIRLEMADKSPVTAIFNPMDGYNCFLTNETVTISDEAQDMPQCDYFLPFVDSMHHPIVEGSMNGVKARFLFDSGARMTMFGDMALTGGKPSTGSYREWMAMLERYAELSLYEAVLDFPCGLHFVGKGALVTQPEYAAPCRMMNIQGMLGIDFLREYNVYILANGGQRGIALIRR